MMTVEYQRLMASEPAQNAGGHPSYELHERVGAFWAEWDKQVEAVKAVLSENLLARHLESLEETV